MDASALADEIVRRDRRRVRLLATLTVLLWVAAGALIPAVFLPLAAEVVKTLDTLEKASAAAPGVSAADIVAAIGPLLKYTIKVTLVSFSFAIIAAVLASITTIALALSIRRSTLRQVSANLAAISEQLRALKPAP
jgi:hypothetical protein